MSRLNKVLYENNITTQRKTKKEKSIPQYNANGKVKRAEISRKKNSRLIFFLWFSLVFIQN